MDNVLYHGSSIKNLDVIKPHKSTHGEYVYATNNYALALVFLSSIGNDLIYSLGRNKKDGAFDLNGDVEIDVDVDKATGALKGVSDTIKKINIKNSIYNKTSYFS